MSNIAQQFNWHKIADIISKRWPSWEPTDHELEDWKRVLCNLALAIMDEALLEVKMCYASDVPKLKWVRDKYYGIVESRRVARQREQASTCASSQEDEQIMAEVERDKRNCLQALRAMAVDEIERRKEIVRSRWRMVTMPAGSNVEEWSWMSRYAVLLATE